MSSIDTENFSPIRDAFITWHFSMANSAQMYAQRGSVHKKPLLWITQQKCYVIQASLTEPELQVLTGGSVEDWHLKFQLYQ